MCRLSMVRFGHADYSRSYARPEGPVKCRTMRNSPGFILVEDFISSEGLSVMIPMTVGYGSTRYYVVYN